MAITKVTSGLISADASSIDLNIDAGTLYLDVSENRVGIGTTSPSEALSVSGNIEIIRTAPHLDLMEDGVTDSNHRFRQNAGNLYIQKLSDDKGTSTDRIVLDGGSGNVGIATTSPAQKLHVTGNIYAGAGNYFTDSTSGYFFGGSGSFTNGVYGVGTNNMAFNVNGSERMRINSSGQVLIGTSTNPTYNHSCVVSGNANIDGVLRVEDIDGTVALSNVVLGLAFPNDADATNGYFVYMTDGNGAIGSISVASGTSVSFNTTSDERLKKNIVDASSQLDTIKNIKVREFDWNKNDYHEVGVIAQEIINVVPNAVQEGGDDVTKHPFAVDYGKIVPYLIKAVQEQQTIIDNLTTRIETLENA